MLGNIFEKADMIFFFEHVVWPACQKCSYTGEDNTHQTNVNTTETEIAQHIHEYTHISNNIGGEVVLNRCLESCYPFFFKRNKTLKC